jgi:hypothetical protein
MRLLAGPICLALAVLSGCAQDTAIPRHQNGIIVGSQGAGSEVVFPSVQVAALSNGQYGDEFSRRDASLMYREPMTAFEADAWPQAPQPSLYLARRISVPTSPNTVLYFGTGSQYRSEGSNWQGAGWYWP